MQAAAGSISFTLATSDMITVATAVIIPSLLWFVRTLFGLINKLDSKIEVISKNVESKIEVVSKNVESKIEVISKDVDELVKSMHRLEVTIVKEQAALEGRTTKNILLALAGKHPSTDAESASDNP